MRLCWYAFQGVACILSPYGAFTEKPPALPGDVYYKKLYYILRLIHIKLLAKFQLIFVVLHLLEYNQTFFHH